MKQLFIIASLFFSMNAFAQNDSAIRLKHDTVIIIKVYVPVTDTTKVTILYKGMFGIVKAKQGFFITHATVDSQNPKDVRIESQVLYDGKFRRWKKSTIDLKAIRI